MIVIRNGMIYDGSGSPPYEGDLAVEGDLIGELAPEIAARGDTEIDASGLAVAPGFINVLSWANAALIQDGRSQGDIRQGVTLEVMGEGWSAGPLTEAMKREAVERQGDIKYEIAWTTLGEFLDHLVKRGVSCNVASFVGAATVRIHEVGYEDRPPRRGNWSECGLWCARLCRKGRSACRRPSSTYRPRSRIRASW
jgi:N-acyl-D-amino-acid deacylase